MDMQMVVWDENHSVDIEEIDNQHELLFDVIYKLDLAVERQESMATITTLLEALIDYTDYLFKTEEKYLALLSLDDYELHQQQHQFFIENLTVFKAQTERIGTVSLSLLYFLKDWLVEHTQMEDKKYAR